MEKPYKTVLVIDDEPGIREVLKLALEMDGYRVICAENGEEGLNYLRQGEKPCVILLDLMMPVMDGWAFVDALARNQVMSSIPIIVVSAFFEKAINFRSVIAIIKKPVDLNILTETIKRHCP